MGFKPLQGQEGKPWEKYQQGQQPESGPWEKYQKKTRVARVQLPDGRVGRFEVAKDTTPEQVESMAHEAYRRGLLTPAAIPEIANFRKKYPQYNDVDDAKLADMLATKYPDAYGDLPGKVKLIPVEGNPFKQGPRLVPVEGNPFDQFDSPEDTYFDPTVQKNKPAGSGGGYFDPTIDPAKVKWEKGAGNIFDQFDEPEGLQGVIDSLSPLERVLVGIGKGFTDIGQGAKQIGLQAGEALGMVPEGRAAEYTRQIKEDERLYDTPLLEQSTGAKVGRIIGQTAATLPIPGGVAGKLGTRIATAAGSGAAAAGLMPVDEGESRLKNMGIGAVTAGGATGVLGAAGKAYGALRGNAVSGRTAELRQLSKEWRVPLSVDDLRGTPALRSAAVLLERVPLVGMGRFREKQSSRLLAAASALKDRYNASGGDIGETLQASLKRTLDTNKAEASRLYDQVTEEAAKRGGTVSLDNVRAIARGIAERENLLPEAVRSESILGPISKYAELGDVPFETARMIRSRLGREVRQLERKAISGSASDEEVAALKRLKGAMENDIRDFAAREGGDLLKTFNEANAFYTEKVVPFKDRMIRKAGSDDFDTDQIVKTFIKNDRENLAAKLMHRLDPEGQATVKYAVLQDAFDKATKSGEVPFSPAQFAGHLERLGKSSRAIFTTEERKQIEGFVKLAKAAKRAGQYAEQPSTGQKMLDATILGGGVAGALVEPVAMLSAAGSSAALTALLTTSMGRAVLTRAAAIPENAPPKVWEHIWRRMYPRAIALAAQEEQAEAKRQEKHQGRGFRPINP